jgi:hypothetical protein
VYELSGVTLVVLEPDPGLRSELVLDLFMHGASVLVAETVEAARDLLEAVRVDAVLAAPALGKALRARVSGTSSLARVPIIVRSGLGAIQTSGTAEA